MVAKQQTPRWLQQVTITQPTTITLASGAPGPLSILILVQDAVGGHAVTLDATAKGVSAIPTDADTSAVLAFVFDGSTFLLQGSPITGL